METFDKDSGWPTTLGIDLKWSKPVEYLTNIVY